VVVLDTLEYGKPEFVLGAKLYQGDIGDQKLVSRICQIEKIKAVVHCAGYKSVPESYENPEKYLENNVTSTGNLIQALIETEVKHFVFSSSCSVYGDPIKIPITEGVPLLPKSPYAASKLLAEKEVQELLLSSQISWVILRVFNAAGARTKPAIGEDWNNSTTLVPEIFRAAILGEELILRGSDYETPDGTGIRDYVHVDDVARAHQSAFEYLQTGYQHGIFNVGTGRGTSVLEILSLIEQVTSKKVKFKFEKRREGDPAVVVSDISLIGSVLGWKPIYQIWDIIKSASCWFASDEFKKMDYRQ
jgi:UDP-glucose-4-epimerase GalE